MSATRSSLRDHAFVLHSYPYGETSLIVELFARHQGRVAVLAKGARSATSRLRGMLTAFQVLDITFSGKGELKSLRSAEYVQVAPQLGGDALLSGFYLNELILRFLGKEDAHPLLFDAYQETIGRLREAAASRDGLIGAALRRFESTLLQESGYGLELARTADTQQPIRPDAYYWVVADVGVLAEDPGSDVPYVQGSALTDLVSGRYDQAPTAQASREVMRYLINRRLDGRELHTRQLLRELRGLA
jgi:DNA repair protein RecO (recombination protein O)